MVLRERIPGVIAVFCQGILRSRRSGLRRWRRNWAPWIERIVTANSAECQLLMLEFDNDKYAATDIVGYQECNGSLRI